MSVSQPDFIFPRPFADNGDKIIIPDAPATFGRANFNEGFPVATQTPLQAGGVAPSRLDFNGLFYMLSNYAFWLQSGGQWSWSDELDYAPPAMVENDGEYYSCVLPSGPGTDAGAQAPSETSGYWRRMLLFGGSVFVDSGFTVGTVTDGDTFTVSAAAEAVQGVIAAGSALSINDKNVDVASVTGTGTTVINVSPAVLTTDDEGAVIWTTPLGGKLKLPADFARSYIAEIRMLPYVPDGWLHANGQVIPDADAAYPALWEWLGGAGSTFAVTLAQWNSQWNAIAEKDLLSQGLCGFYVRDTSAKTIKLPDIRGAYLGGAGYDGAGVGGVKWDELREIEGTVRGVINSSTAGVFTDGTGVFATQVFNVQSFTATLAGPNGRASTLNFKASDDSNVQTGNKNAPRTLHLYPCVCAR